MKTNEVEYKPLIPILGLAERLIEEGKTTHRVGLFDFKSNTPMAKRKTEIIKIFSKFGSDYKMKTIKDPMEHYLIVSDYMMKGLVEAEYDSETSKIINKTIKDGFPRFVGSFAGYNVVYIPKIKNFVATIVIGEDLETNYKVLTVTRN